MTADKKKQLEDAYKAFMDSMRLEFPMNKLEEFVIPDVMGYGTTIDEKVFNYDGLLDIIKMQEAQSENIQFDMIVTPVHRKISKDENTAVFVDEVLVSMQLEDGLNEFTARVSSVLDYIDGQWKLIHWHGSKAVETEGDTWHKDEWKQKNEELQRLVDEKTTDLEKKNQELEIEAALERVWSRTMAMQKSAELKEVIQLVYEQLVHLGIRTEHAGFIMDYKAQEDMHIWLADPLGIPAEINIPYFDSPHWNSFIEAKEKGRDFFTNNLDFDTKNKFYKKLFNHIPELSEESKEFYFSCPGLALSTVLLDNIGLYIENFTGTPYTEEENDILMRFGNVFQQAYTRFNDLKKAEDQAREAQIDAALERVRSKTMAMHNSQDVGKTVISLFDEVLKLGIDKSIRCGIGILDKEKDHMETWSATSFPNGEVDLTMGLLDMRIHPMLIGLKKAWDSGKSCYRYDYIGEDVSKYYKALNNEPEYPFQRDLKGLPDNEYHRSFFFTEGILFTFAPNPISESAANVFNRFAGVFGQTYRRYLDLKNAEAQAREAQIEAALERVRSRSMAMHKSEELADLSFELVKQVHALGIDTWFCAFNIYDEDQKGSLEWGSNTQGTYEEYRTPREGIFLRYYEAGQTGEELFVNEINEKDCPGHYDYLCSLPGVGEQLLKMKDAGIAFPSSQIDHVAFFKYGYIIFITFEPVPESHDIFKRFAKVFEQSYTRFLDLKKAEEQAREAQIEAVLERVRSRTMAMQQSEEMPEVANNLFLQVQELGFPAWSAGYCIWEEDVNSASCSMSSEGVIQKSFSLPSKGEGYDFLTPLKEGKSFYVAELGGKELVEHYNFMRGLPVVGEILDKILSEGFELPTFQIFHIVYFKHGYLMFITYEPVPEAHEIFKRFATVFDQTYTRFLDLQKAEAQSREAQIELALERIRARVTSMTESAELLDIMVMMRTEFVSLGHEAHYFWYMRYLQDTYEKAMTSGDGARIGMVMTLPRHIHGDIKLLADWEKSNEPTVVFAMDVETAVDYVHKMITLGDFKQVDPNAPTLDDIRNLGGLTFIMARTTYGEIGYSLPGHVPDPPEEDLSTLERFAGVFDLAYRRFEDLKKSEQQNRETQIELALERVRAKTMAMHKTSELQDVINVVHQQFRSLNMDISGGAFIAINDEIRKEIACWGAGGTADYVQRVHIPFLNRPIYKEIIKGINKGPGFFSEEYTHKEKIEFFDHLFKHPPYSNSPAAHKKEVMARPGGYTRSTAVSEFTSIFIINHHGRKFSDADNDILKRFGKVFEQTYTRFLDLQKAEALARESMIEAAMERVRARALAMHEPEELKEVADVMRHEMGLLGVEELETSSIYINDESTEQAECWYAIKDIRDKQKKLVIDYFTLNLNDTWVGREMLKFYNSKDQQTSIFMTGQPRIEWIRYCEEKSVPFRGYYGEEIPDRTYHLYKFSHGAIGAATSGDISDENWGLLKRAASVFSLAYSRFKDLTQARIDLQNLKEEKKRAEDALTELQATQSQLIHAEKMASLGELTAGIAHEIQNPLNFVNNFSEVSVDLIDEMKEEMESGDIEEVNAISGDLKQNLEKISYHGHRASTIVKGMLEHSRAGDGLKEPTDINELADEYLRLAYHGLRAKDKSFNADFNADLDDTIPKVKVIPQDIGRVLLNLINNAFYAVNSSEKGNGNEYKPEVKVKTKKLNNLVEIIVQDNGDGIPADLQEKIFQPFFTTKPSGEGTGLGLSLSFDIIKKGHKGNLTLQSRQGEGTEFKIVLPID